MLTIEVHHEDGSWWAQVLDLPGVFASGETLEELRHGLSEAVSLYLHDEVDAGRLGDFPEDLDDLAAFESGDRTVLVPC